MTRHFRRIAIGAVDIAILAMFLGGLLIAVSGGGIVEVVGIRIRARRVDNPLLVLVVLVGVRLALRSWGPLLGSGRSVDSFLSCTFRFATDSPARLAGWFARPGRTLLVIGAVVFGVKAVLAWTLPGFFSGDDIEVHEMSLGVLLGKQWPIWELRSAFFPMAFIYPAQRTAHALGATTPEALVFAGRVAVALVSTAVIPLTWLAARRLCPAEPRLAAIAVLLVATSKLLVSFGSSELPRPVSTVFVVAAFVTLLRSGWRAAASGGALLGVAASFRFSEAFFVPAALVTFLLERRVRQTAIVVAAAAVAFLAITMMADALYWGSPLSSVTAAVNYTVVQRQSSRGFEPPWEYFALVPTWTTPLLLGLALVGSSARNPDSWWLWLTVLLLSLMPHKESRYLIPVMPFFSIAAARGVLRAIDWARQPVPSGGVRRWTRDLFAPLLLISLLHEAGGWRLIRSNEGVRLAQRLRPEQPVGVAAQDYWRLGGRPYMWPHEPLIDFPVDLLGDPDRTAEVLTNVRFVALRTRTARTIGDTVLEPLGFVRDAVWRGEDYVLYARSSVK